MLEWNETCYFAGYRPGDFCGEFAALRGHSRLLYNYFAVITGVKPLLDDWIPAAALEDFVSVCKKRYGLLVETGAVWLDEASDEYVEAISGTHGLSTTKFIGRKYVKGETEGNVHVFVARTSDALELGYRTGWYPLIIDGRIVHKPYVDFIRFGRALGYPGCCIDNFVKHNADGGFLQRIYSGGAPGAPECNCLAKDTSYSYIYHMPCSPDCRETIRYASDLRGEIAKLDGLYAKAIDAHLRLPCLVFDEQHIYAFEGEARGDVVSYTRANFVGKPRYNRHIELLLEGDSVRVTPRKIAVSKGGAPIGEIRKSKPADGIIASFTQ